MPYSSAGHRRLRCRGPWTGLAWSWTPSASSEASARDDLEADRLGLRLDGGRNRYDDERVAAGLQPLARQPTLELEGVRAGDSVDLGVADHHRAPTVGPSPIRPFFGHALAVDPASRGGLGECD